MYYNSGFGSELNYFYLAALLARYSGRTLLINGTRWNYGDYQRVFETDHLPRCPDVIVEERYDGENFVIPPSTVKHAALTKGEWEGKIHWFKVIQQNTLPFGVFRHTAQVLYRPSKEEYYAVHIRRGDKTIEAQLFNVSDYLSLLESTIKKIEGRTVTRETEGVNLYLASDDLDTVYAEVVALRPAWHIFWIPGYKDLHHSGHVQADFNGKSKEERFQETAYLMTEIEVLTNSKIIICTLSSNICTLLQLLRTQPANTLD
eukprot:gene17732-21143_t